MNKRRRSITPGCYKIDPPIHLYEGICNCGIDKARAEGYAAAMKDAAERLKERAALWKFDPKYHSEKRETNLVRGSSVVWDIAAVEIINLTAKLERMAEAQGTKQSEK